MKKYLPILLILCLICILISSCSETISQETPEIPLGAADPALIEESEQPKNDDMSNPDPPPAEARKIDVDLTILSDTLAIAEITNILSRPDDYLGKTIKARGKVKYSYMGDSDELYHFVVITDVSACCEHFLEFVWNGEHSYPDDYPEEASWVDVVGVYGLYEEFGAQYCRLEVDEITVL